MYDNLGAFTCYGIEYVFEYLGEDRIKLRVENLEKEPSMGISLKDFTYQNAENSYFNGAGTLWVFDLLIQWFEDIELVQFLYENSKRYNEDNYYNDGLLKIKWGEYVESLNLLLRDGAENKVYLEVNKINRYWIEYHFFYMQLSKSIKKTFKSLKELDLIGSYEVKKSKLIGKVLLEIKTRRKPLTGQYLMYKEGFIWYNLELEETQKSFSSYQFRKNKNLYRLIVDNEKSIARIELRETDSYSEKYISILRNIKLRKMWAEVIANYIGNFDKISLRIKQYCSPYSNRISSNSIMWDIYEYYKQENNPQRANEIAKLNNTYLDVWRVIPETDEEGDEE